MDNGVHHSNQELRWWPKVLHGIMLRSAHVLTLPSVFTGCTAAAREGLGDLDRHVTQVGRLLAVQSDNDWGTSEALPIDRSPYRTEYQQAGTRTPAGCKGQAVTPRT